MRRARRLKGRSTPSPTISDDDWEDSDLQEDEPKIKKLVELTNDGKSRKKRTRKLRKADCSPHPSGARRV
jgi:hypothetical protein